MKAYLVSISSGLRRGIAVCGMSCEKSRTTASRSCWSSRHGIGRKRFGISESNTSKNSKGELACPRELFPQGTSIIFGITVPDLDAAIQFFQDALGADLLWKFGPFDETPTGVKINSIHLAMLRLGPNINVELMTFDADTQNRTMPSNVDYGATHIAFFVDDIDAAAQSLKEHGAELLKGSLDAKGDVKQGERIWYFRTPWGAFMEILWRPDHLGYEKETESRLYKPHDRWSAD